ncbi:hypothetical protein Hanom_Chr06g00539431 [Helianthus anomalus]
MVKEKGSDFHKKHNICCVLDEKLPNMEPFKEVLKFLKHRRICKALTDKHKCDGSHVRTFWNAAHYVEDETAIHSVVTVKDENNKDVDIPVKITVDDIRRVLDFKDKDEDPIIGSERLCKGLWMRMGYAGFVNCQACTKAKHSIPYKFLVYSVIHALGHRKGAFDESPDYIMNIITYVYKGVKKGEEPKLRKKFVAILKADYQAPEEDKWRHDNSDSDDETKKMEAFVPKKTRWWGKKDEKLRNRTPKVTTPKAATKKDTKKHNSPPRLVDEPIDLPPEITAAENVETAVGGETLKETLAGGETLKETLAEGEVHTDSSEIESDIEVTQLAPTSYVSGKFRLKTTPKKKKASNEEDETYEPTSAEKEKLKKKGIRK